MSWIVTGHLWHLSEVSLGSKYIQWYWYTICSSDSEWSFCLDDMEVASQDGPQNTYFSFILGNKTRHYSCLRLVLNYWMVSSCFAWLHTATKVFDNCLVYKDLVCYHWLLEGSIMSIRYTRIYLILMAVSMVMRPTGGVMWVPLVIVHLLRGGHHQWIVLREVFVVGWEQYNTNSVGAFGPKRWTEYYL